MKHTRIEFNFGNYRFTGIPLLSWALFIMGLFGAHRVYLQRPYAFWQTILLLSASFFIYSTLEGIKLDKGKGRYKHYLRVLFVKIGFWKSLDKYVDIICLTRRAKHNIITKKGEEDVPGYFRYEIYFASRNHLDTILVKTAYSRTDADHDLQALSEMFDREWVQYNPACRRPRKVLGRKDNLANIVI